MTQQNLLLKISGLYTHPSHLGAVPQGALLKATNVFIDRENIAESRRGYKLYSDAMGSSLTNTAHQLLNYKDRILRHWGTGPGHFLEWDNGSGTFTAFSTTLTGNTVATTTTVSGLLSTAQLFVGTFVSGVGIAPNTTIASITNNNTLELSIPSSFTGPTSLTFTYDIEEVIEGLRIKGIEQTGNFYFTTSQGVKKISARTAADFPSTPITNAGGVKALDLKADIDPAAGFLSANSVVAYRVVWGIKDQNDNLILGAPSERVIIRNLTATAVTVDLTITIPREITLAYFFQIYRSAVFADPLGTQDPGDELGLVYEANPTQTDLNNGFVTVHDVTPDSFRGANLYTNADSGEGIAQANDVPPLARDIAEFKGYTFYANTTTKQQLNLSLLSTSAFVSGTSSITVTDGATSNTYTFTTTTLNGDTHTGSTTVDNISSTAPLTAGLSLSNANIPDGSYIVSILGPNSIQISQPATLGIVATPIVFATENASLKQVALSQFATPSQQVDETARSLVRIINEQAGEIVNAFYVSGPADLPGLILFEARNLNQLPVFLNVDSSSTGLEFSPNLPTSGNSVISTDNVSTNRIYYSKFQQPEAVPLLNFIDIGPKDRAIVRILPLRDSLFILKEEGVYRLSGLTAPFQVYPFDFSTIIKAADSAVVLNNLIYMISNQGVVTVSDSGVSIISRPIEDLLIKLLIPQYTTFTTSTFGISYESDRAYYLFTVLNKSDAVATQCFRFNTLTNTWTILDISKRSGIVNHADDKLYLGAADVNKLEQERKLFDRTDLADRELALTIGPNAIIGNSITLSSVTNVTIGDILVQTQNLNTSQFNRILTKLDRDSLLSPHNYVSTTSVSSGVTLNNALDDLINKIAADPGRTAVVGSTSSATYTALTPTPVGFTGMQTTFNSLIALLNADAGVGYSDYVTSTGTTDYEMPVLSVDPVHNVITTTFNFPLIEGPVTIYNHINTELQFVPQQLTDVSITKQASEGTLIFEDSSFTQATLSYASDLSANFEPINIAGNGPGNFGTNLYGNGIFGGNGEGIPFRTYVPRDKQRCRYMSINFKHIFAREVFSLYGISLTFTPTSTRGWR